MNGRLTIAPIADGQELTLRLGGTGRVPLPDAMGGSNVR